MMTRGLTHTHTRTHTHTKAQLILYIIASVECQFSIQSVKGLVSSIMLHKLAILIYFVFMYNGNNKIFGQQLMLWLSYLHYETVNKIWINSTQTHDVCGPRKIKRIIKKKKRVVRALDEWFKITSIQEPNDVDIRSDFFFF